MGKYLEWDTYDIETDEIWIIFDQDYKDLEKIYEDIYQTCKTNKLNVGITNPNFEFWLLIHAPGIEKYDRELLKNNPKNYGKKLFPDASKKKKYIQILVSKNLGGYKKGSKIQFDRFLPGVELAIEQEKMFQQDSQKIICELGSNIGVLIKKMQDKI